MSVHIEVGVGPLGYVQVARSAATACTATPARGVAPTAVKAAIVRAGTNQRAIAAYLGVSQQSVGRVIAGGMRSARIEAELEKLTGKPIHATPSRRGPQKKVWLGHQVAA